MSAWLRFACTLAAIATAKAAGSQITKPCSPIRLVKAMVVPSAIAVIAKASAAGERDIFAASSATAIMTSMPPK